MEKMSSVLSWSVDEVEIWLDNSGLSHLKKTLCDEHKVDGRTLLMLQEDDLRRPPLELKCLADIKHLLYHINYIKTGESFRDERVRMSLGLQNSTSLTSLGLPSVNSAPSLIQQMGDFPPSRSGGMMGYPGSSDFRHSQDSAEGSCQRVPFLPVKGDYGPSSKKTEKRFRTEEAKSDYEKKQEAIASDSESEPSHDCNSVDDKTRLRTLDGEMRNSLCSNCACILKSPKSTFSTKLDPERWKAFIAMTYALCVSWLTAFVMTVVHDRVPDMDKYPPLPDLILDNIPHIPWAFNMSEVTGMTLLTIWLVVLLFHKHRFILMRRFFSIAGTIFLLRCITMLITSLSVPGAHLDCKPAPYGTWAKRLHAAYVIWSGAGMSIQGVRTCGDYIFSGHTVSLTLLNFFITEYTSRRVYFLHTFTWLCNCFGIFFILAAHEHYSIDVFIAFYISSRIFLYYHTLVYNRALLRSHQGQDAKRTWFYFPLFSFFEQNVDGKIPHEFELPIHYDDLRRAMEKITEGLKSMRRSNSNLPCDERKTR